VNPSLEGDDAAAARKRRRIIVTSVILALVAAGFYASIFLAVSSRHAHG
jgi:hypothetical protein